MTPSNNDAIFMELRAELDRTTRKMVGGVYPMGNRQCLTLHELETHVPPKVLLQCYSCLMVHKPSMRELIRLYGKVQWGNPNKEIEEMNRDLIERKKKKSSTFQPPAPGLSNTNTNSTTNNIKTTTSSVSGGKHAPKQRKKRRKGTHEMISNGTRSRQPSNNIKDKRNIVNKNMDQSNNNNNNNNNDDKTMQNETNTTNTNTNNITNTRNTNTTTSSTTTTPIQIPFSTIQILRSLAVCLKTIPAKKAALQWAEHQLTIQSNGKIDPHRLLGQWKQHYQKLELKAIVASRRKERRKLPKQKRKDKIRIKKQEQQQYYDKGKEMEREMLSMGGAFDMGSRVDFRTLISNDDNDDKEDPESMYPDDFEEQASNRNNTSRDSDSNSNSSDSDDFEQDEIEDHEWSFVTERSL